MTSRKDPLVTGQYYHIFNRSIARYKIFTSVKDFQRFLDALVYFRSPEPFLKFSRFLELSEKNRRNILLNQSEPIIDIIAYCILPTHFHLILKQNIDESISTYLGNLENSYSRYFNVKYKRKGHLWEAKFKNILVESDEQLLHLTRYIHLNPVSAGIVDNPEDWQWSSYNEYISGEETLCKYKDIIDISQEDYKKFVMDRKDYQRELSKIKAMLIDDYSG